MQFEYWTHPCWLTDPAALFKLAFEEPLSLVSRQVTELYHKVQ